MAGKKSNSPLSQLLGVTIILTVAAVLALISNPDLAGQFKATIPLQTSDLFNIPPPEVLISPLPAAITHCSCTCRAPAQNPDDPGEKLCLNDPPYTDENPCVTDQPENTEEQGWLECEEPNGGSCGGTAEGSGQSITGTWDCGPRLTGEDMPAPLFTPDPPDEEELPHPWESPFVG